MCELILSGLIVGFVNVGPGEYLVQSMNADNVVVECVIEIPDEKMTEIS
jgi:hypothetical protein